MSHVVLLGDSIFDNGSYVPGEPDVVAQLRQCLPADARATLLAVDGHVTANVEQQLLRLPSDATHLFISVGGNDALGHMHLLQGSEDTRATVIGEFTQAYLRFSQEYGQMLNAVTGLLRPTAVCTIYDSVPGLDDSAVMALSLFNDIILRKAIACRLPVLDLREVCSKPEDYSDLSPIEPSAIGGSKIANAISQIVGRHDFELPQTAIYAGS